MIAVRVGTNPQSLKEFQGKFMSRVMDAVVHDPAAELVVATSGVRAA
jgi:hypothetical protein